MFPSVPVTIVQHPPVFLNLEASVDAAVGWIAAAARDGARLIAFPETWLPGYPIWLDEAPGAGLWEHPPAKAVFRRLFANAVTVPGPEVARLQRAADAAGAVVVMGCHERDGATLYNTILIFRPGAAVPHRHRKLVPTYTERLLWGQGDAAGLDSVETDMGRVGALVCWEHWMPLTRAALHATGERIHVAQWPTVHEKHQIASRHYAFEGRCFVLAAGTYLTRGDLLAGWDSIAGADPLGRGLLAEIAGPDDRALQNGGSTIIDPQGLHVTEPLYGRSALVSATLDLGVVAEAALTLDSDGHYSRPDIFTLTVDRSRRSNVRFEG